MKEIAMSFPWSKNNKEKKGEPYQPKIEIGRKGTFHIDAEELFRSPEVKKLLKSLKDLDIGKEHNP